MEMLSNGVLMNYSHLRSVRRAVLRIRAGAMQKFIAAMAFIFVALFSAALFSNAPARADNFPSRPITLIVPFPPGGSTDVAARVMADKMGAALGQPVIVENVGGAGGSIGVGRLAR